MRSSTPRHWQRFWEQADHLELEDVYGTDGRMVREVVRLGDPAGKRILEVGAGTGRDAVALARAGAEVLTLDYVSGSLHLTRKAADGAGVTVRTVCGDALGSPFADGTFDVVFAHTVMMHLHEPRRALAELCRVCKPGGIVGLRDGLGSFDHLPGFPPDARVGDLQALLAAATRASGGMPDVGVHLRGWLHALGMQVVRSEPQAVVYEGPEDLALLCAWHQGLLRGGLGRVAVAEGLVSAEALDAYLRRMEGWGEDPSAISVVVWIEHVAHKPHA